MITVAFHSNQLCLTGTEVALFDYADYNERLLGNRSVIVSDQNSPNNNCEAIAKFSARFPVYLYSDRRQIEGVLAKEGVDLLYCIKAGFNDGLCSNLCKTAVHVVFEYMEPHGDVYAYISEWLANHMSAGKLPFVPHMVHLPETDEDLRSELGIPTGAVVFGRYGGFYTFDVPFVPLVVETVAERIPEIYFVFMNTKPFGRPRSNLIFLEGSSDMWRKTKFINTCDAMLHARASGETFGLAVGEFSIRNKPVLTWADSPQRCHIQILGERGLYYHGPADLTRMLLEFRPDPNRCWDCYSKQFSPQAVMERFRRVFIGGGEARLA